MLKTKDGLVQNVSEKREGNLRLVLPCDASDDKQLKAKTQLLKQYQKKGFSIGLEILLEMDYLFNRDILERIITNVEGLPKSMVLSVHGPIELKKGSHRNFFQSEEGFSNLIKTVQFALLINAESINIHAHRFLSYEALKKAREDQKIPALKRESILKVKADLIRLRERVSFLPKIYVENVPYCLTVDNILNPEEALYELCFVDPQDFLKIIDPDKNIFATIDVDHLAQVYDSSQLLSKIQKIGRGLGQIHFSDVGTLWQPFISLVEEGLIPGDGRIGERIFRELLGYFIDYSRTQELNIVIEVHDRDYTELKESKIALRKVARWLKEISSLKR